MSLSKSLTHNAVGEEKEEETSQSLIADLYSGYDTSTGKKNKKQTRQRKIDRPLKLYTYGRLQMFQLYQEKKTDEDFKVS